MREEAQRWLLQARADMGSAQQALVYGSHYLAAFLAHQAVEKALKAWHIERLRAMPPHTHDLLALGTVLSVPDTVTGLLRRLNPHYAVSRYPDAANGVPAMQYDEAIARPLVDAAEQVLSWLDSASTSVP